MLTATAVPAFPLPFTSGRRPCPDAGLELYLKEVARVRPLSLGEEERLLAASTRGNTKARDALIQRSLRLVPVVAAEYLDSGMSLLELIEAGNLGLVRAAKSYRYVDGPFCVFAAGRIALAIEAALVAARQIVH